MIESRLRVKTLSPVIATLRLLPRAFPPTLEVRMPYTEIYIRSFGDALIAAFDLRDRFRRAHGAAVLDEEGEIIDLTVFTLREHTIETALSYAYFFAEQPFPSRQAVLLSAVRRGVTHPSEDDLETFRRAREELAAKGIELLDWIRCDGKNALSLSFASEAGTWDEEGRPVKA